MNEVESAAETFWCKKDDCESRELIFFIDLIHRLIGKEQNENERNTESDINQHRLKCNF